MLIEHREYIALIDEIEYLKKDNSLLTKQNSALTQQLVKARQRIQQISQFHQQNMKLIQSLHVKTISHQSDNTKQIVSHIQKTSHQTKQFLDLKFKALENRTFNQNKQSQLKMAKDKIELYELNDFINKIRSIHKETTHSETQKIKKLSFNQLTKWIKCLALFSLSQQKLGVTGSFSTANLKKSSINPSKLKETQSTFNFPNSQSNSKLY